MAKRAPAKAEKISPWSTVGVEKHKDKRVPARVLTGEDRGLWEKALADEFRFKLAILTSGNTVLTAGGRQSAVIAPAAVFLPHRSAVRLPLKECGASDKLILFHPCYIYGRLGFEDWAAGPNDPAAFQDGYLLSRFFADSSPADRIVILEPSQARYMAMAADRMRSELQGQPDWFWPCRARSYLLEILIACARLAETQSGPEPASAAAGSAAGTDPDLSPVLNFLVSRLDEKLSVERIAREFNTNRTTLQDRIRRSTGLSVAQYVIRLRVQTAAVLLRNTSLSIGEIMERTGFNDTTHFSRSFRKFTDRSPSRYREAFVVPDYIK